MAARNENSDFMFEKQFMVNVQDLYVDKDVFVDVPGQTLPLSRWTDVSDDDETMSHLLRMFWTWENLVEKTLDRSMFEVDVVSADPSGHDDDGRVSFCSRFLVNSLLALSCVSTSTLTIG